MSSAAEPSRTVVVIDDDEDDRFLFRRMLRRAVPGTDVIEYDAADEALRDFTDDGCFEARFGGRGVLVFLDINMPRMNGFEFLERMSAASRADVRVILLSASESPSDRARAATFDLVDETLVKPISRARLAELLG